MLSVREKFIDKARKIHGNKYDYSKVEYVNNETPVCIICPEHGEFWQKPHNHLRGYGCQKCAYVTSSNKNRDTLEIFIEKARKVHGDKFDYSKVEYKSTNEKVCIICPEHGEFWMTPLRHLNSMGCLKCASDSKYQKNRDTLENFIEKARKVHGNKYDYSKVDYVNSKTKVCIICNKHGEFWETPHNHLHLSGERCPFCINEILKLKEENKETKKQSKILKKKIALEDKKRNFITNSKLIHNNKYDYSKVEYKTSKTKVCIICPEHGEFWQTPHNHLSGHGCPLCAKDDLRNKYTFNTEKFIENARKVHGDKYDYSLVNYVNNKTKVKIICKTHGVFEQVPAMHFNEKQGCPLCGTLSSFDENEILDFLKEHTNYTIIQREHSIIKPYEIDIYIPELKFGIEYNGLRWHSEEFDKDKYYHLNKLEKCNKNGIKLINIFSDEYLSNKELVKNKLLHILNKNNGKHIYGRKTFIKEITNTECNDFLNKYHIQGKSLSSIRLGCFYENELIGVMTFIKRKKYWELNRYATNYNYICVGVGGKLFKYFIDNFNPNKVVSFADRRWTVDLENNLYTKLGFKLVKILPPDYSYYCKKYYGERRVHKFNFRKKTLHKLYGLPLSMTENEMVKELGAFKVWNCGLLKYEWNL